MGIVKITKKGDKGMKRILTSILIVLFLMVSMSAYTETIRQGGDRYSFNPSKIVTKTAAYTITQSDSLVKVTTSSANITITLPTVSATRAAGTKAFKIQKTDAKIYAVVVTPASGDTIGGESTRYIMGQNDYIVVSPGSGNDWDIAFESAYVKEDYEAGTVALSGKVVNCGSTTTCSASASSVRTVYGYVTLTSGEAVVSGIAPAFTATSSYVCTATSEGNTYEVKVARTSTSSITLTSASTADTSVVNYICVGN